MPGMEMRMGMGLRQTLSQRLEHKLDQTLRLTQSQVQAFHTSGEEGSEDQSIILEKLLQDLRYSVFSDWKDFYDRCMKRIKKEDRTESAKELITNLRRIVELTHPSLNEIKSLLELGVYARGNNEIPNVVYGHIDGILQSETGKGLEDKLALIKLGNTLEKNRGNTTTAYEFLHRTAESEKFSSQSKFSRIFSKVNAIAKEAPDTLRFVNNYFERVLGGRESIDESLILSGFEYVEDLHLLSKERVKDDYISDAKDLLSREDFGEIREKYKNVPLPVLANLVRFGLNNELIKKADSLFSQEYLAKKIDPRRRIFRSLYTLDSNPEKSKVLEHLLSNIKSAEQVSKILSHLEMLQGTGDFVYFFDETDGSRLIRRLSDYAINSNLGMIGLSKDYKERIAENPDRIQKGNLLKIISTFGGVLTAYYSEGMPLLKEITEHIIDDDIEDWRYSHDKSEMQLKCLSGTVEAWKQNESSERLIGDLKGLQPRINALKILADELKIQYQTLVGVEASQETLQGLEHRVNEITSMFKSESHDIDKKALGKEKRELLTQYETLQTILGVSDVTPESLLTVAQNVGKAIERISYEDLRTTFKEVKNILDSKDVKNLERVTVIETDAPDKMFNIGRTPIQSCQRWTERTGYNKCLLAYVADSNKKLYQVLDENGNVIVRSIVRLMQFDKESPVLLVEGPYATRWTRDYGRVLFAQVAQRALGLNEALGEPIAIASNDRRIQEVMADFGKQYDSKLHSKEYERKLPESKNGFEYSDSLGGCLSSGSKIRRELKYFFIASK